VIYVSSTADMFIAGVLVIGVVSAHPGVAVVLGFWPAWSCASAPSCCSACRFLMLVAAVDYLARPAWIAADVILWSAVAAALGVAILALFGVFEKRRNDVLPRDRGT